MKVLIIVILIQEKQLIAEVNLKDHEAILGFAQAVFNAGDYPRSAEILSPALELAPDSPYVLLLHANLLGKLGERDKGLAVFEQAKVLKAAQDAARPKHTAPGMSSWEP